MQVSYLLQKIESYRGLAILTTNLKTSIDQAFLRRLRFVVQFPFPDIAQREEIWKRMFPQKTPTEKLDSKKGSGAGLDDGIREPMETAFGADFSGVKVHADGESDQLNKSLNSRAFATGQDIFFSQGAYNPGSRNGQELLAHELTHVVQQNGNTVQPKSVTKIARKENKIESKIAKNTQEQKEEDNESQVEKSTSQTSSPLDDNTDKTSQTVTAKSNKDSFKNVATNPTSRDGQLMLAHKLTHVNSRNGNKINKLNVDNVVQTNLFNDTKKKIQNVSETVLGALAGEFNNDPSVTQIIIDGIISLIPILDQIADGRDIAAHIYFMTTKGEYNKIERWIGLAFSLIGCIPELGTVIKSASKLLFKGTGKVLPHLKELLQLISKILPNGTVNSFSSFLSQNWHKYAQQGITKWQEILNQLYRTVNLIPGILLQKKNQVLNKLKEIQGLSGKMLKSAFDTIKVKISKVLDDLASQLNHKRGKLNTNPNKWLSKHRDNVIKKYGADGMKMLSEGVIAKRVTKQGHTLKVLANGKIVRCSTCSELAKEFPQELADPKNRQLAEWFNSVQTRTTKDPESVVGEIAEIEKQLQAFRKANPKFSSDIIQPPPIKSGNRYSPNPSWKKQLPAFPDAKPAKRKTSVQGGGGLRERWKDNNGFIYEWDSQHGTIEKYNTKGKHLGEFDPLTGQQTKFSDPTRSVEP